MRAPIEEADKWTGLLRSQVMPNVTWMELVPTPWANEELARCPSTKRALHWIPYFDVSAAWWDLHKARVSHIVDCTHRMMVADWFVVVVVARFFISTPLICLDL